MEQLTRLRFNVQDFSVHRTEADLPVLRGHAAVFDNVVDFGWFLESIAPGAFQASIERGDDVRALFNHDPSMVLGRTKNDTLKLKEDEKGLFSEIFPPNTQLGRDLVVSIERGDIDQMSFGFYIRKEEIIRKENAKTHYRILEAELFDVSPVTFPAYEATDIEVQRHIRSRMEQSDREARASFEYRRRNLSLARRR